MAKVILTGFMGTGKSKVGQSLAARLGCPFVDTDELVERGEQRSIAAIFATDGEAFFRTAERRAIALAAAVPSAVVATGGGAILDAGNFATLHAAAPIVCLTASAEVIHERTLSSGGRPLLRQQGGQKEIERLLAKRAPSYAKADLTVDTSDRTVDEVVDEIVEFVRRGRDGIPG